MGGKRMKDLIAWGGAVALFMVCAPLPVYGTGGVCPPKYDDGRPVAALRMEAKDQGIILRYGGGPDQCDRLGARDPWVFEADGTYYMHYDAAGPEGWLCSLAVSKDLIHWQKKGPVLDFGVPSEDDEKSASYGTTYCDGDQWHMFYLGTPNASEPPDRIPSFPYLTMKAKASNPAGPWVKQGNVVPFRTQSNTYYSVTASPGQTVKHGDEFLQIFSATTQIPGVRHVKRTLGIARTRNLDGPWTVDPLPMLPIEEQIENSSLYYEKSNQTWFLFTNHIGLDDIEYTDAIWVYWSKDLNRWDPQNKAVVLDGQNCTWAKKCIGLPSVVQVGDRLALFYDAPEGNSVSHMKRHIGLAWLELPLSPPVEFKPVYRNPIEVPTDGREIADPSVYKFKDRFYLLSTQGYLDHGKGFRVWVSTNLVDWTFHRSVPIAGKLDPMMAPDLVYHEGTYYLYWSVDDPNHDPKGIHYGAKYTPKGATFDPFGPDAQYEIFTYDFLKTEHHNIDGEIFFDRNDVYMFFCGHGGIRYKKLQSLEEAGGAAAQQLTACVVDGIDIQPGEPGSNGWTEAPAIFFQNGFYYLTYSGVHFLRNDYQIHSARGRTIKSIKPGNSNPLIIHCEGNVNGMGNNNWITGPDLKTKYTTYHAKIGAGIFDPSKQTGFMRKLMLDRYEVDPKDGIVTAAPTFTEQPVPVPVGWSADPATDPSAMERIAKQSSTANFVLEGHAKGTGGAGHFGITAADGTIKLAIHTSGRLEYCIGSRGWMDTKIKNIRPQVWHKLKIDKQGETVRFFYDDRFVEQDTVSSCKGGALGYFAEEAEAEFSWLGFSNRL